MVTVEYSRPRTEIEPQCRKIQPQRPTPKYPGQVGVDDYAAGATHNQHVSRQVNMKGARITALLVWNRGQNLPFTWG